jgi:hypothetical protein
MMRVRRICVAAGLLTAIGLGPASATAEAAGQVDGRFVLTTRAPAAPTGLHVRAFFRRAGDPNGKPPPLRSAVIHGPAGLRFDTTTLRQCTASDPEIQARGADACPRASRLTIGSFAGITGFGPPLDPVLGDDHVFNGPRQLIEVITGQGRPAQTIVVDRLTINGSTLTAHPPRAPGGPPEGEGSVRSLEFRIPVRTAVGKSLITTPPACPSVGHWTTTATYSFGDGSTYTTVGKLPCAGPGRGDQRRLRLAVRPRRVRAGRRVRLRFRVRSNAPICVLGAKVRIGRHRVNVNRRGRATMRLRFRRRGIRRARVSKAGCRRATARIRVLPRKRRHSARR